MTSTIYVFTLYGRVLNQLKVAYNNSLRRFMKLPLRNNPSEMFVNLYIRSFHEMLGIFTFGFMSRIIVSNSVLITNNYNSPCRLYIQILGLDGIVYSLKQS